MVGNQDRPKSAVQAIRDNFDRGAGDYAGFEGRTGFFSNLLGKLLELAPLPRGGRVLDVGCGTGASLSGLAEAVGPGGEVVGIDISPGMLKIARRRLGPEVTLACVDGCNYAEALTPGFDAVVYNAVLFMLPDTEASLGSALQVLRPGGSLLVSNLDRVSVNGVLVADILSENGIRAGRHSLSPWSTVKPLVERYFTDVVQSTLEMAMEPELFVEFYGMEPMSAGLLPRLPYGERREIVEDLGADFVRQGKTPLQRWMLLAARKPTP